MGYFFPLGLFRSFGRVDSANHKGFYATRLPKFTACHIPLPLLVRVPRPWPGQPPFYYLCFHLVTTVWPSPVVSDVPPHWIQYADSGPPRRARGRPRGIWPRLWCGSLQPLCPRPRRSPNGIAQSPLCGTWRAASSSAAASARKWRPPPRPGVSSGMSCPGRCPHGRLLLMSPSGPRRSAL